VGIIQEQEISLVFCAVRHQLARMNAPKLLAFVACGVLTAGSFASAQESTDPVGFVTIDAPPNSDVLVGVPLCQAPVFTGAVMGLESETLSFAGAPFEHLDLGSGLFYLRIKSGSQEGHWTPVVGNTNSSITVEDSFGISPGDVVSVQNHTTLATAFPDTSAGTSFISSPSVFVRTGTEIFTFSQVGASINRAKNQTFAYSGGEWRAFPTNGNADNQILWPDTYFIFRNNSIAELKVTFTGCVDQGVFSQILQTQTSDNDYVTFNSRPVPVSLDDLDLGESSAFASSPNVFIRNDELFVFDNSAPGINKAKSATYVFVDDGGSNVGWRKFPNNTIDVGSDTIAPGAGFIIRKKSGAEQTFAWSQDAPWIAD